MKSYYKKKVIEAGCDEAGRGCIAGPVFAAAVILPADLKIEGLNDSKLLSAKERSRLRIEIEKKAIAWSVAKCSEDEIFKHNILRASLMAMHKALRGMSVYPEFILVDGNRFVPFDEVEHLCVIKGDSKFTSIAAASVLCKFYRDEYMLALHEKYPVYNWSKNKGYPTIEHRKAISTYGSCEYHRKGFRLLSENPVKKLF